jgi:hypothetical protein
MALSFILCNKLGEPITEPVLTSCFLVFIFDVLGLRNSDVSLVLQSFRFTVMTSDTLNLRASCMCIQCYTYIFVLLRHENFIPLHI